MARRTSVMPCERARASAARRGPDRVGRARCAASSRTTAGGRASARTCAATFPCRYLALRARSTARSTRLPPAPWRPDCPSTIQNVTVLVRAAATPRSAESARPRETSARCAADCCTSSCASGHYPADGESRTTDDRCGSRGSGGGRPRLRTRSDSLSRRGRSGAFRPGAESGCCRSGGEKGLRPQTRMSSRSSAGSRRDRQSTSDGLQLSTAMLLGGTSLVGKPSRDEVATFLGKSSTCGGRRPVGPPGACQQSCLTGQNYPR